MNILLWFLLKVCLEMAYKIYNTQEKRRRIEIK